MKNKEFVAQSKQLTKLYQEIGGEGQVVIFHGTCEDGKFGWWKVVIDSPDDSVEFLGETFEEALAVAQEEHYDRFHGAWLNE